MTASLLAALILVVVIGVLGIVVIGSIVQPAHGSTATVNPAREGDDLLPEDREAVPTGRHAQHQPSPRSRSLRRSRPAHPRHGDVRG